MSYFQANPIKSTFPILFLIPSLCVVYQRINVSCMESIAKKKLLSFILSGFKFQIRFIGPGISVILSMRQIPEGRET